MTSVSIERREHERGAALFLAAILMIVMLAFAAIVIDLSATRSDRASNQSISDSATAAGAMEINDNGGESGCLTAISYFEEISGETVSGHDCTSLPTTCTSPTSSAATSGTAGQFTIEVTYPVDDSDPLMITSAIGAAAPSVIALDGDSCDRIGVSILESRDTLFAGVIGVQQSSTEVHTVARADNQDSQRTINLLLLERTDCPALGVNGTVTVNSYLDPAGNLQPGRIALDSDGSGGGCSAGTVSAGGSGVINAGLIETFASGGPGCAFPACENKNGSQTIAVTQMDERLTRAQVDWRYNCKLVYPVAMDIQGCRGTATNGPYMDQLTAAIDGVAYPSGLTGPPFQSYSALHPCGNLASPVTVAVGNWVVDCAITVKDAVTFQGGNVIFEHDVVIDAAGVLSVNTPPSPYPFPPTCTWTAGTAFDIADSCPEAAFVYLRNGKKLVKRGQGGIVLRNTTMYLHPGSEVVMTGGTGNLVWVAPISGPFEDLSLWSDSNKEIKMGGGAALDLEGVFFAPYANIAYAGGGAQNTARAQFISNTLEVWGTANLTIAPDPNRIIYFPEPRTTILIR